MGAETEMAPEKESTTPTNDGETRREKVRYGWTGEILETKETEAGA